MMIDIIEGFPFFCSVPQRSVEYRC